MIGKRFRFGSIDRWAVLVPLFRRYVCARKCHRAGWYWRRGKIGGNWVLSLGAFRVGTFLKNDVYDCMEFE